RCFRYHLSVAFGGLVNYIVLLGLTMISIFYLFANLIGIALGFVANYLGGEYVVWRKTKSTF
ncbi:MAG TPA: glycosyltransferase family 2 protein, partial [Piscirickettsiaceae bacterium]|nr:glycosyltransferase family 2 protein [Piscirickettsiaceae bacterium]